MNCITIHCVGQYCAFLGVEAFVFKAFIRNLLHRPGVVRLLLGFVVGQPQILIHDALKFRIAKDFFVGVTLLDKAL